jgi:hypothetical protein
MGIVELILLALPIFGGLVCVMDDGLWDRKQ